MKKLLRSTLILLGLTLCSNATSFPTTEGTLENAGDINTYPVSVDEWSIYANYEPHFVDSSACD